MSILYRRFVLVAAFISAMGAITANVIQETREAKSSPVNRLDQFRAISPTCKNTNLCSIAPGKIFLAGAMQG